MVLTNGKQFHPIHMQTFNRRNTIWNKILKYLTPFLKYKFIYFNGRQIKMKEIKDKYKK